MTSLTTESRRRPSRRLRRRAFTLLEIIVVVTIIALLATMVAPRVLKWLGRSKVNVAQAEVAKLAETLRLYLLDNNLSRPDPDMDLGVLTEGEDPLLAKADYLIDPWEHPYELVVPGEENIDFDIVSAGEDGELGTDDDIVN